MRFSRFRNQMEGTTGTKRGPKKNTTKGKKGEKANMGEPASHLLTMLPTPLPPSVPIEQHPNRLKMEPVDYIPYMNPVKCEPINDEPLGPGNFPDLHGMHPWPQPNLTPRATFDPQLRTSNTFFPSRMYPASAGTPSTTTAMAPLNLHPFYPHFTMSQDLHMQEVGGQHPIFSNAPVLSWEPHTPPQPSSQPQTPLMKTEEDNGLTETSCKIEPYQLD